MTAATRVCNWAKDWATTGLNVTWTNHDPASSLKLWYEANKNNANPPMPSAATLMVCYEMPIYVAVCAGALTPKVLIGLYREHRTNNKSCRSSRGAGSGAFMTRPAIR